MIHKKNILHFKIFCTNLAGNHLVEIKICTNICSAEKLTKRSTVLLLCLVSFSAEQKLFYSFIFSITRSWLNISYTNMKQTSHGSVRSVILLTHQGKDLMLTLDIITKVRMICMCVISVPIKQSQKQI